MVNAYRKVRKRAIDLFTAGLNVDEVYREPGFKSTLHRRTLKRWYEAFHMHGGAIILRKRSGRSRKVSREVGEVMLKIVNEDPALYLREMRDELKERGVANPPSLSSTFGDFSKAVG